jgi:MFS family permease
MPDDSKLARTGGTHPPGKPIKTSVPLALFLLLGGVISAAQLGKAFVAMPLIQAEMSLGIAIVSFIIATFATLGAALGMGMGLLLRRVGARRSLIGGMIIMAAGSLLGAAAETPAELIASRIIEGVGFLGAVIVIPDLIGAVASGRDRNFFFGLWGTFLPTGSALMLLLGPLLPIIGWRQLWLSQAAVALLYALAAFILLPRAAAAPASAAPSLLATARRVLADPASVLLAAVFGFYTFQYFVLAGFLPVILVGTLGLPLSTATLFTAGVVTANALGNVCAGLLSRAGFPLWISMCAALSGYALSAPLIYSAGLPAGGIAALAALTIGVAGLLPGSVFAAVPRLVRADLVTPTMGLIQQASNIGQFLGPVAAGLFVSRFGWPAVPFLLIPAVLAGLIAVILLRPRLVR